MFSLSLSAVCLPLESTGELAASCPQAPASCRSSSMSAQWRRRSTSPACRERWGQPSLPPAPLLVNKRGQSFRQYELVKGMLPVYLSGKLMVLPSSGNPLRDPVNAPVSSSFSVNFLNLSSTCVSPVKLIEQGKYWICWASTGFRASAVAFIVVVIFLSEEGKELSWKPLTLAK